MNSVYFDDFFVSSFIFCKKKKKPLSATKCVFIGLPMLPKDVKANVRFCMHIYTLT